MEDIDPTPHVEAILDFWFGPLDDSSLLDREREPFRTQFLRWYGKRPEIDDAIGDRFGSLLRSVSEGRGWAERVDRWAQVPKGLLALTVLLDQFPRNIYRESPRMYRWDSLGLLVSEAARAEAKDYTLVERMFAWVPVMHAECPTLQHTMLEAFEQLVEDAYDKSPHNVGFFEFARDFARRHVEIVDRFGRFPHRNAILGRRNRGEEASFLAAGNAGF